MAHKECQIDPKRRQEGAKRDKKANRNVNTRKGPNQDDPKTILDLDLKVLVG